MAKKKVKKRKKTPKTPAKKAGTGGAKVVYLCLGSNVGDREEYIEQAVFLLGKIKGVELLRRSSNYETEAVGGPDQPQFINAAVSLRTALTPHKLIEELHTIENALGREREVEWGPRTIDIDILLFGDVILSEDELQIPHPLLHERLFVLQPLKEIAAHVIHPVLEKSIEDILEEVKAEGGHEKYDDELPGFKEIRKGAPDDYERW